MLRMLAISACLSIAAQVAHAAPADATAIREAVIGNTVQGEMTLGGKYSEFYAKDGTIHAKDYAGTWRIRGDRMCFKYGEEAATCYQVELNGPAITWVKDGKADGNGTIVPGNPNQF